eukprot:s2322_g3.t1
MHCHTGATNAVYQAAAVQFSKECPGKWRQYPVWCGTDANEQPHWSEDPELQHGRLDTGSSNLNILANQLLAHDIRPVAPRRPQWSAATHFPRDTRRRGRQIDIVWVRSLVTSQSEIDAARRHVIGTDHALLYCDVWGGKSQLRWGNDSRPRYLNKTIPQKILVDAYDLSQLAKQCTGPRKSAAYSDPPEVLQAIRSARDDCDKKKWKQVHRLRRQARRTWEADRMSAILHGEWHQYRSLQKEKKRRTGWWGGLLHDTTSHDLTGRVQQHLEHKLVKEFGKDWDELLQMQTDCIEPGDEFEEFTLLDVREVLQEMKPHSAVGPDGISVGFLRGAASDDFVAPQLLSLINHIVASLQQPEEWRDNFLALLAKVKSPRKPGDLRPICGRGLPEKEVDHELKFLLAQLFTYKLIGQVPGGHTIVIEPNVGIKQGAPESAEVFGLVMNDILTSLTEQRAWGELGRAFADLDIDLVFYQDDIFIVESQLARLGRKVKVLERRLKRSGLMLATEKTKIVASEFYQGPRKIKVGETLFEIAPHHESIKVLGLSFSLQQAPSQQARELLGRVRDAAMGHKDILTGRASWTKKGDMIRCLVESQFRWTAGNLQTHMDLDGSNSPVTDNGGQRNEPNTFVFGTPNGVDFSLSLSALSPFLYGTLSTHLLFVNEDLYAN